MIKETQTETLTLYSEVLRRILLSRAAIWIICLVSAVCPQKNVIFPTPYVRPAADRYLLSSTFEFVPLFGYLKKKNPICWW